MPIRSRAGAATLTPRPFLIFALLGSNLLLLPGCGSGVDGYAETVSRNRAPFINIDRIRVREAVIGETTFDECAMDNVLTFRPVLEINYSIIDLEDSCGAAYFYFSENFGLSYRLATESTFRELVDSPACMTDPDTDFCSPCQPDVPTGMSSAGAMSMEPDNHVTATCMNDSGGAANRFYWDIIADDVGFPNPQQILFCIVPTDPNNRLPDDVSKANNGILDGSADGMEIEAEIINREIVDVTTNVGFFCTETILVTTPYTRVEINDADIRSVAVGVEGTLFEIPVGIENVGAGGPTCFYVGIQYDHEHVNFRHFSQSGAPPISSDLVRGTPLLGSGSVALVSPDPQSMTGNEDFVVVQVTSPVPLGNGDLFQLLMMAQPIPGVPGTTDSSLVELVPVGGEACEQSPPTCADRSDWQVPEPSYTGVSSGGAADPCDGVSYRFEIEPPTLVTCVKNGGPRCCMKDIEAGDIVGGGLGITYFLTDAEQDRVSIQMECSTDGGATWGSMTERIADPRHDGTLDLTTGPREPCMGLSPPPCDIPACGVGDFAAAQPHTFVWDLVADLPNGPLCNALVRINLDDRVTMIEGCRQPMPTLFVGPGLNFRRVADPSYLADTMISTSGGGSPIILPEVGASDQIQIYAVNAGGREVDITAEVQLTSSDPTVIDVVLDPMTGVVTVTSQPGDPGNDCVTIDALFNGFLPPLDTCPLIIVDSATGASLTQLLGQFAACTDLGGPDYLGARGPYLQLGDFDAEIPGLPSGAPIPGFGGTVDVTCFVNVGAVDIGAYSVDLEWDSAALAYVDIFRSPSLLNLSVNTSRAADPTAILEWNNLTVVSGSSGVVELETVRFRIACPSGLCTTPFTLRVDQLVDQGLNPIGTFAGGTARAATDLSAEFQVP